ncbi:class I SAM-dependent methyltransferase [Candidatus Omnitrophota bacterium]
MVFSKEWDSVYKENKNMSIWPWSDLIGYVMRYSRPTGPPFRVLELGCGAGANIPFFEHLKVNYYAIEGSAFIVERLKESFFDLKDNIICGDFTLEIPFTGEFDLIIDRSSLTHNTTELIRRCLDNVHNKLKPGGKYIGIDWFSTAHSDYQKGKGIPEDAVFSKAGYRDGQFADVGIVHFSDKTHILDLFNRFNISMLEHKVYKREVPQGHVSAAWNLVAEKE